MRAPHGVAVRVKRVKSRDYRPRRAHHGRAKTWPPIRPCAHKRAEEGAGQWYLALQRLRRSDRQKQRGRLYCWATPELEARCRGQTVRRGKARTACATPCL